MKLESDNRQKLKDFFSQEYRSLQLYVDSRIRDTTSRNAEDIIQDVALKLFTGADRYAPINNVAAFVYRSIKNRIIDVMRSSKKTESVDDFNELFGLEQLLSQHQDIYSTDKMIEILKECIEQLKTPYRDIIIAIDYEGYTYNEISKETGIPMGTLMSRRHRALGILYHKLETEIKKQSN